jgi:hypothetical protein
MLAILEAIRLWRPYLLGKKFYIQTNQCSLKYFVEQRIATPEQQKWVAKLLSYDYEIIYRPILHHIFTSQVSVWQEIKKASQ